MLTRSCLQSARQWYSAMCSIPSGKRTIGWRAGNTTQTILCLWSVRTTSTGLLITCAHGVIPPILFARLKVLVRSMLTSILTISIYTEMRRVVLSSIGWVIKRRVRSEKGSRVLGLELCLMSNLIEDVHGAQKKGKRYMSTRVNKFPETRNLTTTFDFLNISNRILRSIYLDTRQSRAKCIGPLSYCLRLFVGKGINSKKRQEILIPRDMAL